MSDVLTSDGLIFGHNLLDVGWVADTIPREPNALGYVDLHISDIAGPGLAIGAALSGRQTVYICRYHQYLWFNLAPVATYAAIAEVNFDTRLPFIFRAISDDGPLGPSGGTRIGLLAQVPNINIFAPINPSEWKFAWSIALETGVPSVFVEHRRDYENSSVVLDDILLHPEITLLGVGSARQDLGSLKQLLCSKGYRVNAFGISFLRPLIISEKILQSAKKSHSIFLLGPDVGDFNFCHTLGYQIANRIGKLPKVFTTRSNQFGYSMSKQSRSVDLVRLVQIMDYKASPLKKEKLD